MAGRAGGTVRARALVRAERPAATTGIAAAAVVAPVRVAPRTAAAGLDVVARVAAVVGHPEAALGAWAGGAVDEVLGLGSGAAVLTWVVGLAAPGAETGAAIGALGMAIVPDRGARHGEAALLRGAEDRVVDAGLDLLPLEACELGFGEAETAVAAVDVLGGHDFPARRIGAPEGEAARGVTECLSYPVGGTLETAPVLFATPTEEVEGGSGFQTERTVSECDRLLLDRAACGGAMSQRSHNTRTRSIEHRTRKDCGVPDSSNVMSSSSWVVCA